jgi:beta-aspartyl-peptidase (threonine type)
VTHPGAARLRLILVGVVLAGLVGLVLLKTFALQPLANLAEKDAVRQVLEKQAEAWNRGDLEGFMAGYWHSPELTTSGKEGWRRGWDTALAHYREQYQDDPQGMGHLTFSDLDVELLGTDAALVRGNWKVEWNAKKPAGGYFTLVLMKKPEGWRIVHDHTSSVAAQP